jgi:hypothetical protein
MKYNNRLDNDMDIAMRAEKVGKKACCVIIILVMFMFLLIYCVRCSLTDYRYRQFNKVLIQIQNNKIKQYCTLHKIKPEVVEISENGRMTFMMNGKLCEIK